MGKILAQEPGSREPYYSAPELAEPLSAVTEPGLLSKVHEELEGIENCTKCHPTSKSPGRTKCSDCHTEIKDRLDKNIGYHGKFLKGNCIDCHKEHKGLDASIIEFDRLQFNHNLALFPLEGKHRLIKCEDCHLLKSGKTGLLSFRYTGLALECYQCHSTPHGGEVSINCQLCHTQTGWTGKHLLFNHNRDSKFKLLGSHIDVACEKCHTQKIYKPQPTECAGCHQDPHQGLLGKNCAACHNEWKWAEARLVFNHDVQTSFPLAGAHRALACTQCHSVKFKGTPQQCSACHSDPHKNKFGADCAKCHNQWSWQEVAAEKFNHNLETGFKLSGAHAKISCQSCHPKGIAISIKGKTCAECHLDLFHRGELGEKCESCHTEESWKITPAQFDHKGATKFELGQLHGGLACAECHLQKGKFKGLTRQCEGCHQDEARFFAGISHFDDITTMPSAMFAEVKCLDCHAIKDPPHQIELISQRCQRCHPSSFSELCSYWNFELDKKAENLAKEMSALKDFLQRQQAKEAKTAVPIEITLDLLTARIDKVREVINRLRHYGLHNLPLAQREFEYALRILDNFQALLSREMRLSSEPLRKSNENLSHDK